MSDDSLLTFRVNAPGRVCLFGEHSDYLGLDVIAAAIDLTIEIVAAPREDNTIRISYLNLNRSDEFSLDSEIQYRTQRDYIRSAFNVMARKGISPRHGWDLQVRGKIPIGAGLSSFLIQVNLISSEEIRRPEPFLQRKFIWSTLLLISLVFLGAWFTRPRIRDVKPGEFALLTRPDLRAVEWIKENLPGEANFLVNSFFAYGGTLVVGSDGGWWLPLLTEHDSSQPPLTYGSETGIRPDYVEFINSLVTLIEENGLDDPGVLSELDQRGIRYIFIGQQQGQVNANSVPLLDVNFLINDPNFSEVYHEDRVWIFKLINTQGQS